jgi:hypothetical protein
MAMLTLPSVQAQNNFGTMIDHAQREMVSVTRRGRVAAYVMSPQVLEDYLDGYLATEAGKNGFASHEETEAFLNSIKDA